MPKCIPVILTFKCLDWWVVNCICTNIYNLMWHSLRIEFPKLNIKGKSTISAKIIGASSEGSGVQHQFPTSATYQIYASPTLNAFPGQPTGKSKLCLSCHDGTVAVDNHSGNTTGTRFIGPGSMGVNLGVHHPISFTYNSALAASDGELNDPSVTMYVMAGCALHNIILK